jgi:chromosomal replication initiator protein
MYLTKQLTDCSLPEIGRQFGGKHHTTVMHSVEKIMELRKSDKDLNRVLNQLTEHLTS